MKVFAFGVAALVAASGASAGLIDTRVDSDPNTSSVVRDGVVSAAEYGNAGYGGGGGGFGGTVGNGRLYIDQGRDQTGAELVHFGFQPGGNLNDLVVIFIDSVPGGFNDADMNDTADGGRNVSSNLSRDANDQFNASFLPDFTVVIGNFGIVTFALNAGNTPGHLGFLNFDGTFTSNNPNLAREHSLPKALLDIGQSFDFFVGYISDSGFTSDEAIPAQPFSGLGNPGFGATGTNLLWDNYNRFNKVPAPGAAALLGLGGLLVGRRRR